MSAKQRKQNKPLFADFESTKSNGRFVKIAWDMLQSKAWSELTLSQRGLYFEIKAEYLPEKSVKGVILPANDKNIMFPSSKWKPLYKGNQRKWQEDRKALIEKGFIRLVESGRTTRTPNIYELSDDWKSYKK